MKTSPFYNTPSDAEMDWDYQGKRPNQVTISRFSFWAITIAVIIVLFIALCIWAVQHPALPLNGHSEFSH